MFELGLDQGWVVLVVFDARKTEVWPVSQGLRRPAVLPESLLGKPYELLLLLFHVVDR